MNPRSQDLRLYPPKTAYRFALDTLMYLPREQETDHPVIVQVLPSANTFYLQQPPRSGEAPQLLDAGENTPRGAVIHYYLRHDFPNLRLEIRDGAENVVVAFSSDESPSSSEHAIPATAGAHRLVWDLRGAAAEPIEVGDRRICAPVVLPGTYAVVLTAGGHTLSENFRVELDPRTEASHEDATEQSRFQHAIREQVTRVHKAVRGIRRLKDEIDHWITRIPQEAADALSEFRNRLITIEDSLVPVKALTHQGNMRTHPRLSDQLAYLFEMVEAADHGPTTQAQRTYAELVSEVDGTLAELDELLAGLDDYNSRIAALDIAPLTWRAEFTPECSIHQTATTKGEPCTSPTPRKDGSSQ